MKVETQSVDVTKIKLSISNGKRLYRSPKLTEYGLVRDLTCGLGGSGSDGYGQVEVAPGASPQENEQRRMRSFLD